MKKPPLNKKLKAEHKSDDAVLMGAQGPREDNKKEQIKKQFAQDALIYERIKCPVLAMVFCLMHQV